MAPARGARKWSTTLAFPATSTVPFFNSAASAGATAEAAKNSLAEKL